MVNIAEMHEWTERSYDSNGRRIFREGVTRQASARRSRQQEPPAWWTNFDELLNGSKQLPRERSADLIKQAGLFDKRIPAWAANFLHATGQGAGYE